MTTEFGRVHGWELQWRYYGGVYPARWNVVFADGRDEVTANQREIDLWRMLKSVQSVNPG